MVKTTADVPPSVASEFAKAPRSSAASEAIASGYTKTKAMQEARSSPSKQFGLPKTVRTTTGKAAEREMAQMEREARKRK